MVRSLARMAQQFATASERLRTDLSIATDQAYVDPDRKGHVTKFATISLLDKWSAFSRGLILESAMGSISTAGGLQLPRGTYRSVADAAREARKTRKGTSGDEPRWHDAMIAITIAKKLDLQNLTTVAAALGDANSPANEIRLYRNACAHESSIDCFDKLQKLTGKTAFSNLAFHAAVSSRTNDGRLLFDYWIDDLQLIAFAAVQ